MKNYKLKNLRELSTEEQLHLSGGTDSTGCSCSVTCECNEKTAYADAKKIATAIADGVKKKLESN